MATVIKHRRTNIVVLEDAEDLEAVCGPGDIAIRAAEDGWWTSFVAEDGSVDSYDMPFPSYNEALWAAKAAAEYASSV